MFFGPKVCGGSVSNSQGRIRYGTVSKLAGSASCKAGCGRMSVQNPRLLSASCLRRDFAIGFRMGFLARVCLRDSWSRSVRGVPLKLRTRGSKLGFSLLLEVRAVQHFAQHCAARVGSVVRTNRLADDPLTGMDSLDRENFLKQGRLRLSDFQFFFSLGQSNRAEFPACVGSRRCFSREWALLCALRHSPTARRGTHFLAANAASDARQAGPAACQAASGGCCSRPGPSAAIPTSSLRRLNFSYSSR
jgi:hypothetical protein